MSPVIEPPAPNNDPGAAQRLIKVTLTYGPEPRIVVGQAAFTVFRFDDPPR